MVISQKETEAGQKRNKFFYGVILKIVEKMQPIPQKKMVALLCVNYGLSNREAERYIKTLVDLEEIERSGDKMGDSGELLLTKKIIDKEEQKEANKEVESFFEDLAPEQETKTETGEVE